MEAYFIIPLVIAFVTTPLISMLATKIGVVDQPGEHKTHTVAKPLLGGLAIFVACVATVLILFPVSNKMISVISASAILVVVGIVDDIISIRPLIKLAGQLLAASVLVFFNAASFTSLLSFFELIYIPHFVTLTLIICWIVLMINAFNLIDGLDGLASGTAAIIFMAMFVIGALAGNGSVVIPLIGLGACMGFLPYNFNPARLFMGDTGSMFLGFTVSVVYLFSIVEPFSVTLVIGSVCIFAYPVLDVTYAIYRRLRRGGNIFAADKGHIHHILRGMGYSVKKTVIILYLISFFSSALAVFLLVTSPSQPLVLLLGALMVFLTLFFFLLLNRASEAARLSQGSKTLKFSHLFRSNYQNWF